MGLIKTVFVSSLVVVVVGMGLYKLHQEPLPPSLHPDPWWGVGEKVPQDTGIRRYIIDIPQKEVDDLTTRLSLPLRLTPGLDQANFTYGINSETLVTIVNHWRDNYQWRKREKRLNKYNHYMTYIEGLDIHFMRASANIGSNTNVKVLPLLMIHGWPGSFVEFYNILPLLTTPQKGSDVVFEVICPSIPGFGFSQGSSKQGLGKLETAQIFLKLMKRLGFEKFYIQGGDWGSAIGTDLATVFPDNVLGLHLNMIYADTPGTNLKIYLGAVLPSGVVVSKEDEHKLYPLSAFYSRLLRETGYLHIQSTKPDTIGTALDQHPVSLAAYILEKFSTLTHDDYINYPDGGLLLIDFPIPIDQILDNICIYWFTNSATTSARFYAENTASNYFTKNTNRIPCRVPTGLAAFPHEVVLMPKNLAAHKYYDIVTYTDYPTGGHFASLESPQLLAADLHHFVNTLNNRNN